MRLRSCVPAIARVGAGLHVVSRPMGVDVLSRLMRIGRGALLALYNRCPACGGLLASHAASDAVCPTCAEALALRRGGYCPLCGALTDDPDGPIVLCATCRTKGRPWDGLAFYGRYDGVLRDLILQFKFFSRLGQGHLLGRLLVAASRRLQFPPEKGPDMLLPVPLHRRRLGWRGFNQSLELAKMVARAMGVPVRTDGIFRIRYTTPQSRLSGPERLENIQGAFRADPAVVGGRAVVLVDDVMTTGATMETATLALRQAGAARVDILVVARASMGDHTAHPARPGNDEGARP